MKNFWNWMKKKEYGVSEYTSYITNGSVMIAPTKQMLMGYILEYAIEKEIPMDIWISKCRLENNSIDDLIVMLVDEINGMVK